MSSGSAVAFVLPTKCGEIAIVSFLFDRVCRGDSTDGGHDLSNKGSVLRATFQIATIYRNLMRHLMATCTCCIFHGMNLKRTRMFLLIIKLLEYISRILWIKRWISSWICWFIPSPINQSKFAFTLMKSYQLFLVLGMLQVLIYYLIQSIGMQSFQWLLFFVRSTNESHSFRHVLFCFQW